MLHNGVVCNQKQKRTIKNATRYTHTGILKIDPDTMKGELS